MLARDHGQAQPERKRVQWTPAMRKMAAERMRLVKGDVQKAGGCEGGAVMPAGVEDRMAELAALPGHSDRARPTSRPCARCGRHRGHGQRYCVGCRQDAKRECNADYHRRHYRRLMPEELSAAKRAIVNRRWRRN